MPASKTPMPALGPDTCRRSPQPSRTGAGAQAPDRRARTNSRKQRARPVHGPCSSPASRFPGQNKDAEGPDFPSLPQPSEIAREAAEKRIAPLSSNYSWAPREAAGAMG